MSRARWNKIMSAYTKNTSGDEGGLRECSVKTLLPLFLVRFYCRVACRGIRCDVGTRLSESVCLVADKMIIHWPHRCTHLKAHQNFDQGEHFTLYATFSPSSHLNCFLWCKSVPATVEIIPGSARNLSFDRLTISLIILAPLNPFAFIDIARQWP